MTETPVRCAQCGTAELAVGPFCPNCGTRLATPAVPLTISPADDRRQPMATTAAAAGRTTLWWTIASAALMVIGGLGPWVNAPLLDAAGTSGDGWFLIIGGLAAGAEAARRMLAPRHLLGIIGLALVGAVGTVVAIVDLGSFDGDNGTLAGLIHPGWGLYLSLLSSLSLCAATVVLYLQHRRSLGAENT
jgi:hypothetical protein